MLSRRYVYLVDNKVPIFFFFCNCLLTTGGQGYRGRYYGSNNSIQEILWKHRNGIIHSEDKGRSREGCGEKEQPVFRLKFRRSSPGRGALERALPTQSHGVESQKEEHTEVLSSVWLEGEVESGKGGQLGRSPQGGFMQGIVGYFE